MPLVVVVLLAGCGSGSETVSSTSLQPRLLPATSLPPVPVGSNVLRFEVERTFDWSDPVNLVGQGLFLPAFTRPSVAVAHFTDAHLRGAVGEELGAGGEKGAHATVGVALFKSEADANRVREWMHHQDLQQPCFTECIYTPGSVTVPGIPSARVVVQTSKVPSKPGGSSSEDEANYLAEFSVGPYLYWTWTHGETRSQPLFLEAVRLYHAHATKSA